MLNSKLRALPAVAVLAVSALATSPATASSTSPVPAGAPSSGWFNTGPEEQNPIFDNGNIRITWGPVYVSNPGGKGIYYVIRYENYSGPAEKLDCDSYAQPDTVRQFIRPTENDLGEPSYAAETVCSETDGQWSATLGPGETLEEGAWFDKIPPSGATVSLELMDEFGYPGSSEYQDPYWKPYDGPPPDTPNGP